MPILASAGAALVMSECTLHTGLPKTKASIRSNLYFNYLETGSMNPMSRAPYFGNSERSQAERPSSPTADLWLLCADFVWPADVRARLCVEAQELTRWMEWARWDH